MTASSVLDRITIDARYCGPPQSGNGGYVCGRLAAYLEGGATVALRRPPPLDVPLDVVRADGGSVELRDAGGLVAVASPGAPEVEAPAAVTLDDATGAAKRYPGFARHPFPTCFTCGPERAEGDGLRVFPGPLPGRSLHAAPWTPHASHADADGLVLDAIVWAALDCTSGFGTGAFDDGVALLGTMSAEVRRAPRAGEPHVVAGWLVGKERRKVYGASALYDARGDVLAVARATWITIDSAGSVNG